MVAHTGGYAPQTAATDLMRTLASEHTLGIPNALFVWAAVSVVVVVILQRTPLGRYIYAIGNKEAAAYLAGVDTRRVTVICFMLCGLAAALAGVLLAGYSTKAYQAMGDAYLLPSIAAVVIGGHKHSGRSWPLSRHAGRRGADRAPQQRPVDHGDA
jgi:ribose transport system permease protein